MSWRRVLRRRGLYRAAVFRELVTWCRTGPATRRTTPLRRTPRRRRRLGRRLARQPSTRRRWPVLRRPPFSTRCRRPSTTAADNRCCSSATERRRPANSKTDRPTYALSTFACNDDIGSRPSDHYFRSVCWFVCLSVCLLWSPYVIGQTIIFSSCSFFPSFSFFVLA